MTLIKKTAVLVKNGTKGYVSVIRVERSVGVKVVLDNYVSGLYLALKIGGGKMTLHKLEKAKSEFDLENAQFESTDEISCLVTDGKETAAEGGKRGMITFKDVEKALSLQAAQAEIISAAAVKPQPEETVNESAETTVENAEKTVDNTEETVAENIETTAEATAVEAETAAENTEPTVENTEVTAETTAGEAETAVENIEITAENTETTAENTETEKIKANPKRERENETFGGILFGERLFKGLTEKDFYISVKDKIDELFVIHPKETALEKLIPSSKWVRINYDEDDYYVTGILYDEDKVSHIVYGVPAVKEVPPPKGTENICDFLPVHGMARYSGYYLIFQNADTGQIIPSN